jgi:DNA invertase Pin-like site-specific DNA recombinase
MAERVRSLGWKQVEVIDSDLGFSAGMASTRREGFERVLSWVALGEVGIVGSRDVSRLSRTDKDWCRLLEVCQIFGTLIADEQQIYDLNYLDDQLVLGIKGTLSVVELKVLRQSDARRPGVEGASWRVIQAPARGVCVGFARQIGITSRSARL